MRILRGLVFVVVLAALGLVGWNIFQYKGGENTQVEKTVPRQEEFSDFTATFEIFTFGTRRDFTARMYHNQSPHVFIESTNPSVIYIKKPGITWRDFFDTLPFSLDENCLVTGTEQVFCTEENNKLRIFLNEVEKPLVLGQEIQPGDVLRVEYGG